MMKGEKMGNTNVQDLMRRVRKHWAPPSREQELHDLQRILAPPTDLPLTHDERAMIERALRRGRDLLDHDDNLIARGARRPWKSFYIPCVGCDRMNPTDFERCSACSHEMTDDERAEAQARGEFRYEF